LPVLFFFQGEYIDVTIGAFLGISTMAGQFIDFVVSWYLIIVPVTMIEIT